MNLIIMHFERMFQFIKLHGIKCHEITNGHVFATKKHINAQKPKAAPAHKAKLSLNKVVYSKLRILFKTTHALNIKGRPARDYLKMNELNKSNGLDVGDCYSTNVNNCTEFASAIADVQCKVIQEHLTESNFVSVIVDGSMCRGVTSVKTQKWWDSPREL